MHSNPNEALKIRFIMSSGDCKIKQWTEFSKQCGCNMAEIDYVQRSRKDIFIGCTVVSS